MIGRAVLLVLDSVGIGAAHDAALFGDEGADTLGHIAQACADGRANRDGVRHGPLHLPHLAARGLGAAAQASTGHMPPGLDLKIPPTGQWGFAIEVTPGKDTPSGHWEMTGAPAAKAFHLFPDAKPAFPAVLTQALIKDAGLPGILGNCHASGITIIEELGEDSHKSGRPICYTSADSVFQIAAHEEHFGLDRLYETCRIARTLCDRLNVARVIARPFVGSNKQDFVRTSNRKDFAVLPPPGNLLESLIKAKRTLISIGKIGDIFAHVNTGQERKGKSNAEHFEQTLAAFKTLPDGGMIFTNLVDFDTDFGHRRDIAGYADALEAFDKRLPELDALLRPGDIVMITADHGNDPSFRGTDHTREHVPVLAWGQGLAPGPIGGRCTFADIGATLAKHLQVEPTAAGTSWL